MDFILTILGVSGATPAYGRFPASQVLQIGQHFFLIDCGEGTQMRISDFNVPKSKINHIFISHLHGDHIFGLPGLLFSYSLNGRQTPLTLYSPPGLSAMIQAQLAPGGSFTYPVHFHEFDPASSSIIFDNDDLTVRTIPLAHRIPTAGFLFSEKPFPANIRKDKIKEYQLTVTQIKAIKEGADLVLEHGEHIPNRNLVHPPYKPRSFAYVSDTRYHEEIIPWIKGVDLLYHEATFGSEMEENARETMHSTAQQAALIARKAAAGQLIIGHYSSRYPSPDPLVEEAKEIFPATLAGVEGQSYPVSRHRLKE